MMKKLMLIGLSAVLVSVMAGCSQSAVEKPVTEATSTSLSLSESSEKVSGNEIVNASTNSDSTSQNEVKIMTVQEVIDMYQKEYPDTDITSIELEKSLGKFVYKVEGVDDNNEYELKIKAETKEIAKSKQEKLDRDEQNRVKRNEDKLDLANVLSIDQATEIAEKEAGAGSATEWDLDRELNVTYWEVKVVDGRKETQVKLDAKTGEILEVEYDD